MDYPEERATEDVARLCPYCATPSRGTNGVLIHLGQVAGRKNHPKDAAEKHTEADFPKVEVDAHGNVVSVAGDSVAPQDIDTEKGGVPRQLIYHLLADLIADGEKLTAHRVRRALLGIESANQPLRSESSHHDLYDALLTQARVDQPDQRVTAAVEAEGIMVACRGASAFYSAPAARNLAAGLKESSVVSDEDDELTDLIAFLRHGADLLDGETERSLHEKFNDWR